MTIDWDAVLPVAFLALMGFSMLLYVVLDGYDLGVGLWMPRATAAEQDLMVASIGPFWDANETWLVLGVGILLIAFPVAHGIVLGALYLPVAAMLVGLVLRGVAFDFRVKAREPHRPLWNRLFFLGSALASVAQGWMLGRYVTGLAEGTAAYAFAALIALALPAAYALLGAGWLVWKTEGELQRKAVRWGRLAWPIAVAGIVAISIATPIASPSVREKWFALPAFLALAAIPLATAAALVGARWLLRRTSRIHAGNDWMPFALVVAVFLLCACGLAYSVFPYVVVDRLDAWQAASSTDALKVIAFGAAFSVPAILGYTVFAYRVFGGKARPLGYA